MREGWIAERRYLTLVPWKYDKIRGLGTLAFIADRGGGGVI